LSTCLEAIKERCPSDGSFILSTAAGRVYFKNVHFQMVNIDLNKVFLSCSILDRIGLDLEALLRTISVNCPTYDVSLDIVQMGDADHAP
jgi:hypothetical protein